ncbi:F-box protein At2g05970-like [Zingiber officinale]|uniref:F-box protein At2g05970-like n=1 Tax=Zingiber officinale TaxID=94328 RepID=UPI001C4B8816|nr:F-box protein At2g05970-like [Zingiber officinale]
MAGGGDGCGDRWVDLSLDLFSLIFSKLSLPQLLRSAAVCVSWSAAAHEVRTRSRRFEFRGQGPWLMFGGGPDRDSSAATFYTLDEGREYTIPLPDAPISRRFLLGSAHGWVITYDTSLGLFQLLNPITGSQIDLPSVVSNHLDIIHDNDERSNIRTRRQFPLIESLIETPPFKAILSADPSLEDDYTVVFIHYFIPSICFTRSGYESWFQLNDVNQFQDILFHKGKLYATTISGSVQVCVIDDARLRRGELPTFTPVIPPDPDHCHFDYLAETPRGDLLNIQRKLGRHDLTVFVEVYRLQLEEEILSRRTEQVKDLGELIIFLGSNHPLCLSASDFPHLRPNSIYFTDELTLFNRHRRTMRIEEQSISGESQSCPPFPVDVGIYSMTDRTFTSILPGDPRLKWPPPVWFKLD